VKGASNCPAAGWPDHQGRKRHVVVGGGQNELRHRSAGPAGGEQNRRRCCSRPPARSTGQFSRTRFSVKPLLDRLGREERPVHLQPRAGKTTNRLLLGAQERRSPETPASAGWSSGPGTSGRGVGRRGRSGLAGLATGHSIPRRRPAPPEDARSARDRNRPPSSIHRRAHVVSRRSLTWPSRGSCSAVPLRSVSTTTNPAQPQPGRTPSTPPSWLPISGSVAENPKLDIDHQPPPPADPTADQDARSMRFQCCLDAGATPSRRRSACPPSASV